MSAPSLVEVLKRMACSWRSLREQAQATADPEARLTLMDQYWEHPIFDFFVLIEEHMGIDRITLQDVATRINSSHGLAPLIKTRRQSPSPAVLNSEVEGLLDEVPIDKPKLPDLRWVYPRLNDCDVNGTTATIFRRFEENHPGVLEIFGAKWQQVPEQQASARQQHVNSSGSGVDKCSLGIAMIISAHQKGDKLTASDLASDLGINRNSLYENREFAPLRKLGSELLNMFGKAKKLGDWEGAKQGDL